MGTHHTRARTHTPTHTHTTFGTSPSARSALPTLHPLPRNLSLASESESRYPPRRPARQGAPRCRRRRPVCCLRRSPAAHGPDRPGARWEPGHGPTLGRPQRWSWPNIPAAAEVYAAAEVSSARGLYALLPSRGRAAYTSGGGRRPGLSLSLARARSLYPHLHSSFAAPPTPFLSLALSPSLPRSLLSLPRKGFRGRTRLAVPGARDQATQPTLAADPHPRSIWPVGRSASALRIGRPAWMRLLCLRLQRLRCRHIALRLLSVDGYAGLPIALRKNLARQSRGRRPRSVLLPNPPFPTDDGDRGLGDGVGGLKVSECPFPLFRDRWGAAGRRVFNVAPDRSLWQALQKYSHNEQTEQTRARARAHARSHHKPVGREAVLTRALGPSSPPSRRNRPMNTHPLASPTPPNTGMHVSRGQPPAENEPYIRLVFSDLWHDLIILRASSSNQEQTDLPCD